VSKRVEALTAQLPPVPEAPRLLEKDVGRAVLSFIEQVRFTRF
jgi:hypothetical protein